MKDKNPYLYSFLNKKMLIMTILGFSSGLPLPLSSGTLQAWLTVSGIDLKLIGLFTVVGLPYTLKFLWAPFLDRFSLPLLTRRRGWILFTQVLLSLTIFSFCFLDPKERIGFIGFSSLLLAFVSASQDIVVDAYRTDSLKRHERGPGASVFILGYRMAMLTSGALALIIADKWGWQLMYFMLSLLMLAGIFGTLLGKEETFVFKDKTNFKEWITIPLLDLFRKDRFFLTVLFIILYKLGDAYLGAMTVPFLIKGVGFSPTEVGMMNKAVGTLCTIFGALFGGVLMVRFNLWNALFYFGLLQMISNLGFILFSIYGKSYLILILCVAFENISGGMGTSAFMAFLMSLCKKEYSATQFAILSSLSAFGRIIISPTSGFVAALTGWTPFFFISSGLALPGLLTLYKLKVFLERERPTQSLP